MANSNPITPAQAVEYKQLIWGDLIYGTKDQIQALGIGAGIPFPIDASRRRVKVRDPRGFLATIESASWKGEGIFSVSIPLFEGHPSPRPIAQPYVPGVTKLEGPSFDEYCGTAEALVAFGLVQPNQFPGQTGMRKTCVRIAPDGSVLGGPPTANHAETRRPGAKEIERAAGGMFRVRVRVSVEQEQQRGERQEVAEHEWEQKIRSLPRPAPLNEKRAATPARPTHLKLVWSTSRP